MDPITIIGLLASITNLVHASKSTLNLAGRFRNGETDLRTLSNDLLLFTEALGGFERILRSRQATHRLSAQLIEGMLKDASGVVIQLQSQLEKIAASSASTVRRMRWVQQSSSITKLHDRLKELNSMLQTFLSIAHTETFMVAVSQQHLYAITAPDDIQTRIVETTASSLLQVPTSPSSHRRLSTSSGISSLGSTSESTVSSQRTLVNSSSSDLPKLVKQDSCDTVVEPFTINSPELPTVRQACHYFCFCSCHDLDVKKLQRGLSKRKKAKTECTDPSCKASPETKAEFSTQVKSFFRTFSGVMSSNSIKVRYNLHTYRMVSEGSDAMRYVKHGNMEGLRASIESGEATIWDTAPDGWSLLHTAAYNRQLPIVRYLLDLGVDTDTGDVGSRKAADLAILKSISQDATETEHKMVEVFSEEDDFVRDFDFTPIHIAALDMYPAEDNERPTLSQLIHFVDEANNAPVGTNWAEWKRRFTTRSPLYGDILEYFRASAFELPKGEKIVHNLIDRQDKKYLWTPLHWAAVAGRVETMDLLVHNGADPLILSNLNANILHSAAESKMDTGLTGALKIWRRCSDQLDINQKNRWLETPLHVASWCSAACVKLLLEAGALPGVQQEDGQVPLHCAGLVTSPDRSSIAALLCGTEDRSHINTQDVDGRPPLFDFLDDAECVAILLHHGAKIDIIDIGGRSSIHHCCYHGYSASLKLLVGCMDDKTLVATKDLNGNTALMEAVSRSHVQCALTLLDIEDVGDIISTEGWAPIHYAARIGDPELLEAVLKHPSFIKGMRTMDGKKASEIAMEAGNWKGACKEFIKKYDFFR